MCSREVYITAIAAEPRGLVETRADWLVGIDGHRQYQSQLISKSSTILCLLKGLGRAKKLAELKQY